MNVAVPAMRQADPNCYILGCAVSCLWVNSFSWLDRCFKQGLHETGIDALSVHPYGFYFPELCIDDGYGHLRGLMQENGVPADFPVFNTKVGYNADEDYMGPERLRLQHQAWHFVRQHLIDLMCDIKFTIWYNWNDDHGFRLVNDDMSALPVFDACSTMTTLLQGYHFVKKLLIDSARDYVLLFENDEAEQILACWTTPTNKDDTPEKVINHPVIIPVDVSDNQLPIYDLYGNASIVDVANNSVSLPITGAPQYLSLSAEK